MIFEDYRPFEHEKGKKGNRSLKLMLTYSDFRLLLLLLHPPAKPIKSGNDFE
jgi:hypothetical protein